MARKVTFTLDDATVRRIEATAERLGKPKSQVIREAVADYHERSGRLTEVERQRLLAVLDRLMNLPIERSSADVEREIDEIRAARRSGGRRSPA